MQRLVRGRRLKAGILNATLVAGSSYLACLALELLSVWSTMSIPVTPVDAAKLAGMRVDQRSKAEVLLDARRQGTELLSVSSPTLMVQAGAFAPDGLVPVGGHSHVTTLMCNEFGEWLSYQSDKHGFNNSDSDWRSPEVVLIGDSFVHGACVQGEDSIAGQLRNAAIPTLNLGMSGLGPLGELAVLAEYLPTSDVRVVFSVYFEGNDIQDLISEARIPTMQAYTVNPGFIQRLPERQVEIDRLWRTAFDTRLGELLQLERDIDSMGSRISALRVLKLTELRLSFGAVRSRLIEEERECSEATMASLDRVLFLMKRRTHAATASLVAVYLPTFGRYVRKPGQKTNSCRPQVLAAFARHEIPLIDIHDRLFRHHPDPTSLFPYRSGGHYTAEAYRAISKEMIDFVLRLRKKQSVQPNSEERSEQGEGSGVRSRPVTSLRAP